MGRLFQKDSIVLDVTSSSIAAMLLDRSFTAYSWFKIPLDTTNESMWNIKKKTDCAKLIKQAKLIFLDKAFMQCKHDFPAVSCTLSDFCNVSKDVHFNERVIYFYDNFKEIFLIVSGHL